MANLFRSWRQILFFNLAAILLAGCLTFDSPKNAGASAAPRPGVGAIPESTNTVLQVGELVKIDFSGAPTEIRPHEEHIKEDGTISLEYIGLLKAAGKTPGQLQNEIYTNYVPKYYRNLNVTVRGSDRFYYVGGEVKLPARQPYLGPITVTGAIKSAQDFTDFAKKRKVRLTRAKGRPIIVDCIKALEDPNLDLPVYPGDRIDVPRRLF